MGQSPPDVRRPGLLARVLRAVAVAGIVLGVVLLLGALAVFLVAYERQSDRIAALQEQNESILGDHHAIGAQFAEQSDRFAEEARKMEEAIQSSYGRGYLAGRRGGRESTSRPERAQRVHRQVASRRALREPA